MKPGMTVAAALLLLPGVAPSRAEAQPLTAALCTASGFVPVPPGSADLIRALEAAGSYSFEAKRAQANHPAWAQDSDIRLACNWMRNPAAELQVQMLRDAPQDRADADTELRGTSWTEPIGKVSLRGGVLLFTRSTRLHVGAGSAPDLITYNGTWMGAVSGGLMSIGVDNVLESRDAVQAIIVQVIDRLSGSSR